MKGEVGVFRSGTRERSEPRAWIGEEDVLTTKDTKGTKGERLIEDNSPYRVRGFQASVSVRRESRGCRATQLSKRSVE